MCFIKRKSRQLLAGNRLSSTRWGMAAKTAAAYSRCDVGLLSWPRIPFGSRVMCVRDPVPRDAFEARAHPSVVFGPSEAVPGGYVVYQDGRLKDLTNVVVSDLEPHDLVWVKSNAERWSEPVGVQAPVQREAWDPAAAGDPSVRVPRPLHHPPPPAGEAPAPEEQRAAAEGHEVVDHPGDMPGDE